VVVPVGSTLRTTPRPKRRNDDVDTDDYSGTMARLKSNGVRILEEMPPNPDNGRRVCFLEAPDGAQIELIEKVQPA
jgi:predicted enzyme related to lactoylglutathione lyase